MFLKTNLGYLSQIALKNMQLLIQITQPAGSVCRPSNRDVRPMSEISSSGNGKVASIADGFPAKVIVSQPSLS